MTFKKIKADILIKGFYMFLGLAASALILFTILKRSTAAALP
jgi:hypothetical protein